MPTRLYVLLAIGIFLLIFLIYELATQKAYGTWEKGRPGRRGSVRELRSRWHIRSVDTSKYWNIIRGQATIMTILFGYVIWELLN